VISIIANDYLRGKHMTKRVISRISLLVQKKRIDINALFDTGATRSFVSLKLAERLGYNRYEKPKEVLLAVKDKKALIIGELIARVRILDYELPLSHVFGVIENLSHEVIIGMDLMEPYEIIINTKKGEISFKRFPPTIELV